MQKHELQLANQEILWTVKKQTKKPNVSRCELQDKNAYDD